ncbi:oligosaccharide flippase family protein [Xylanimonas ulmi]|uniref:oligosaccharide flippase family protein n=1 Tax=Xylanimonas ulmi TaxID=228973 RepID=UPI0013EEBDCE|nr:oligosaccharide flippase family protein [Xylanibacterium ulmi]
MAWTTLQTWAIRLTGFATIALLARLLTPADFGLVAIATALPPMLQPLADMGLSTYILQADKPTKRTYSTVFWYSAGAGIVVTLLLLAAAPLVGVVVDSPDVVPVSAAIAPMALLVILGAVPVAILRRTLRFRALAMMSFVAGLIGQVIAVAMALAGFGAWALVWQALSVQLIQLVLAWVVSRFRPQLTFSLAEFKHMTRFGVKVIGAHIAEPAGLWAVNAVIAGALGPAGLGYVNIAQRLITLSQEMTTTALGPVTTVMFSRIRGAADRLLAGYLRAVSVSTAIVGVVLVFVAVGAPQLIPLLFGGQWGPSAGPAQVLAVAGLAVAMTGIDSALFISVGRPGTWFAYFTGLQIITVLAAMALAPHGLIAYALGALAAATTGAVARWILVGRLLHAPWFAVATPLLRTLAPIAVAAGFGYGVSLLVAGLPRVAALAVIGVVVVVAFAGALRLAVRPTWDELSRLAASAWGLLRRRSRRGAGGEDSADGDSTPAEQTTVTV